jgi:hypothetical protein
MIRRRRPGPSCSARAWIDEARARLPAANVAILEVAAELAYERARVDQDDDGGIAWLVREHAAMPIEDVAGALHRVTVDDVSRALKTAHVAGIIARRETDGAYGFIVPPDVLRARRRRRRLSQQQLSLGLRCADDRNVDRARDDQRDVRRDDQRDVRRDDQRDDSVTLHADPESNRENEDGTSSALLSSSSSIKKEERRIDRETRESSDVAVSMHALASELWRDRLIADSREIDPLDDDLRKAIETFVVSQPARGTFDHRRRLLEHVAASDWLWKQRVGPPLTLRWLLSNELVLARIEDALRGKGAGYLRFSKKLSPARGVPPMFTKQLPPTANGPPTELSDDEIAKLPKVVREVYLRRGKGGGS